MDTSETFIKKADCEEIQGLADDYHDDFSVSCWHAPNHVVCKGHFSDWHSGYKYCPVCAKPLKITPEYSICHRMEGDDNIWLPRQDQLQEMIKARYKDFTYAAVIGKFLDWARGDGRQCNSMEQLWLAFVMKEKFGKTWDGTDWTKLN